jgi:hypothetical protein
MERSEEDLIRSRISLKVAIEALQRELAYIEKALKQKNSEASLTENFFWAVLVPILRSSSEGMTSAQIKNALIKIGHTVNANALSTFLSRNKARNRLILSERTTPPKWRLSTELKNTGGSD